MCANAELYSNKNIKKKLFVPVGSGGCNNKETKYFFKWVYWKIYKRKLTVKKIKLFDFEKTLLIPDKNEIAS